MSKPALTPTAYQSRSRSGPLPRICLCRKCFRREEDRHAELGSSRAAPAEPTPRRQAKGIRIAALTDDPLHRMGMRFPGAWEGRSDPTERWQDDVRIKKIEGKRCQAAVRPRGGRALARRSADGPRIPRCPDRPGRYLQSGPRLRPATHGPRHDWRARADRGAGRVGRGRTPTSTKGARSDRLISSETRPRRSSEEDFMLGCGSLLPRPTHAREWPARLDRPAAVKWRAPHVRPRPIQLHRPFPQSFREGSSRDAGRSVNRRSPLSQWGVVRPIIRTTTPTSRPPPPADNELGPAGRQFPGAEWTVPLQARSALPTNALNRFHNLKC